MKGLRADVFKPGGQSYSNGGISARVDEVTVVGIPGGEIFEPTEKAPAVKIVPGNGRGTAKIVVATLVRACVHCGATAGGGQAEPICNVGGLVGAHSYADTWVAERPANAAGPMFGGCYVATSDSRFSDEVERIVGGRFYGAVALHDRFETQELHEMLSS